MSTFPFPLENIAEQARLWTETYELRRERALKKLENALKGYLHNQIIRNAIAGHSHLTVRFHKLPIQDVLPLPEIQVLTDEEIQVLENALIDWSEEQQLSYKYKGEYKVKICW